MKKPGVLGDALGQLGGLGKELGKQTAGAISGGASDAAKQITPHTPENTLEKEQPGETPVDAAKNAEQTEDIVKSLYGVTEQTPQNPQNSLAPTDEKMSQETKEMLENNKDKSPEEIEKLMQLRNQLHKESYYDPTFNRPAPLRPEEAQEKQETAAARMERLEQEDLQEKNKKQDKNKPLAVQMERERAEKYRGSSG